MLIMTNPDHQHLQWIHDRIVHVYGESENVDFLIRLRAIIADVKRREMAMMDAVDEGIKDSLITEYERI